MDKDTEKLIQRCGAMIIGGLAVFFLVAALMMTFAPLGL